MSVELLAPAWLALLAAVPLLWLVRARVRVPAHAVLRAAVLALLVVGLARPVVWTAEEREHAVFVVDASASVRAGSADALSAAVKALPRSVIATRIAIGEGAAPDARFERSLALDAPGSPLAAALELGARSIPEGARGSVTLVSDGAATDRRWGDALVALQERGLPVHAVALARAPARVHVRALQARGTLRVGHTGQIEVALVGDEPRATVVLGGPEGELGRAEVELVEGRASVVFAWEPRAAGFVSLRATASGDAASGAPHEHSLERLLAVQEPLRALYLGQRVQGAAQRWSELVGPGVSFEAWQPSDGAAAPELARYDLAIVDDMPAETLGSELQRALVEAVSQRGLGLLASGGEAAFGPGGYHDTALAEVLPVESVQKEEKRDPSTTLVLIIDTSGSMGGERIQLAKEVARLAMGRLLPHDKVGIVEFYGAKRWAAPIQPASNSIDLARAINRMDAGGGTVILPAIEEAFYGLQNVQTRYKHVLVLTDGGVENGAFEPLLRRMADEGINVSTVLIGPEAHSEFLVDIANWGKGRFYSVPDRFNLPEVLFKQPTTSRLPSYKPGTFALDARGGPGWWGAVEPASAPPVAGYVETSARPGAEVLIEVRGERDPLLASWRYGLGRVTTLATEPVGPGTQPWRDWSGYGALLARVLARTADDGRAAFAFRLERRGAELELVAERRSAEELQPSARTIDEAGAAQRELAFDERAPGVFVARWIAPPDAAVRVLAGVAGDEREPPQRLASSPREDEVAELAFDARSALPLARVAQSTGGDVVPLQALAGFRPRAGGPEAPQRLRELAPLCFALALALYLFEIFHRRRDARRAS